MKKAEILILALILLVITIPVFLNTTLPAFSFFSMNDFALPSGFMKITFDMVSVLLALLIIFTSVVIILERRDPARTLAWLLILIFIPILGFMLYLIFGRQFRKRRMTAKKKFLNNRIYPLNESFSECPEYLPPVTKPKEHLINLILNNADFPLTLNNLVSVLNDGQQIFSAFFEAINNAHEHIHLETYILRQDVIGLKLVNLLIQKSQEGVKVRIIYDGLGSRELNAAYLKKLRRAGIQIEPFFPVRLPFLHTRINYRNHRKILVIDGRIGFVGGANIGDEYISGNPELGLWRESHLQIQGNAVYFLQRIFLQDWFFLTREALEEDYTHLFPLKENPGQHIVQITASGPDFQWESIMQVYYYAITTASKSVYLTSPYFVPNESILTALKTAALSGVDVKILLPAKSDNKAVFWAARSYLEELMEAGIEVYLYHKRFIHSKVLTIDGLVSTIGSANMDQRSFSLNFEVNAFIYDQEIAEGLEKDFFTDLSLSEQLDLDSFKARPLGKKVIESGARLLSPIL